jgi:hypothetical protein
MEAKNAAQIAHAYLRANRSPCPLPNAIHHARLNVLFSGALRPAVVVDVENSRLKLGSPTCLNWLELTGFETLM